MPKYTHHWGFLGDTSVKEHTCQCRRCKRHGTNPWMWKVPWRRARQPTPVFLPGESHGWATVYRVAKSQTWLKWLSTRMCTHIHRCARKNGSSGRFSLFLSMVRMDGVTEEPTDEDNESCVTNSLSRNTYIFTLKSSELLISGSTDSSIHGILQARILAWVAIPFSRESFWPRDQIHVSWLAGGFFTTDPTGKP